MSCRLTNRCRQRGMAASTVAKAMVDRPVPLRERIAPWGHAPLRGSRWQVPRAWALDVRRRDSLPGALSNWHESKC